MLIVTENINKMAIQKFNVQRESETNSMEALMSLSFYEFNYNFIRDTLPLPPEVERTQLPFNEIGEPGITTQMWYYLNRGRLRYIGLQEFIQQAPNINRSYRYTHSLEDIIEIQIFEEMEQIVQQIQNIEFPDWEIPLYDAEPIPLTIWSELSNRLNIE